MRVSKRILPRYRVILTFTPAAEQAADTTPADDADWFENGGECSRCARYHEPNETTIATIEEGRAMMRGEIPSRLYHSFEEMLADLDTKD